MQLDKQEMARESQHEAVRHMFARYIAMIFAVLSVFIAKVSADLASDLSNISTVITSLTTIFTTMMGIFMQPPLVIYVGLGIFVTFVALVAGLLMRRRRR